MKPLVHHEGLVVPVVAANIDTDILVPKQYLKRVERTGLADYLFDRWRYLDRGNATDDPYVDCATREPDPAFVLNLPQYKGASILLAGANFGCGSSREQAVWAIAEWGIRAVIAPSFGDIFFNNCYANGILPIRLAGPDMDVLLRNAGRAGYSLQIDLPAQKVSDGSGGEWLFDIDPFRKSSLLEGRDAIALTLQKAAAISRFEQAHWSSQLWLASSAPAFHQSSTNPEPTT
ncbi:MAG: 3-isopropylmalate dehydratase small subunit [Pseudomonadota bacterium]